MKFIKSVFLGLFALLVFGFFASVNAQEDLTRCTFIGDVCVTKTLFEESFSNDSQKKTCFTNFDDSGEGEEDLCKDNSGILSASLKAIADGLGGAPSAIVEKVSLADSGETKYRIKKFTRTPGAGEYVLAASGHLYSSPIEKGSVWASKNFQKIKSSVVPGAVYAQQEESTVYFPGLGYNLLRPVQQFWSLNRNIAYSLLIIFVIIVAIMILFRRSLDGQNLITLTNALPRIALSIILITFSYGLSGFFIDIITIGANFTQAVLVSTPGSPGYNTIWNSYIESGTNRFIPIVDQLVDDEKTPGKIAVQIDDIYVSIWGIFGTANLNIASPEGGGDDQIDIIPTNAGPTNPYYNFVAGFLTLFNQTDSDGLNVVSTLGQNILYAVFVFAAFAATVRLFFALLRAYITLLVYPIISPFIFLAVSIPSMSFKVITHYINSMLSSALAFVAVYAMFLFIIIITYEPTIQENLTYIPPLLGYNSDPALGGRIVKTLIGFGMFLITPMIPGQIKELLNVATNIYSQEIQKGTAQGISSAQKWGGALVSGIVGADKNKSS